MLRNSILHDRRGRKREESLGPVSKTGARAITHDRWLGRAFPEGPTGRGEEMGFGGGEGSVSSERGGQEVVDHDKGHRLTKGKPRTSYKDPRDKRPIAPLLHLPRIFPSFLPSFSPFSPLSFLLPSRCMDICKGTLSIEFSSRVYVYTYIRICMRATEVTQSRLYGYHGSVSTMDPFSSGEVADSKESLMNIR